MAAGQKSFLSDAPPLGSKTSSLSEKVAFPFLKNILNKKRNFWHILPAATMMLNIGKRKILLKPSSSSLRASIVFLLNSIVSERTILGFINLT